MMSKLKVEFIALISLSMSLGASEIDQRIEVYTQSDEVKITVDTLIKNVRAKSIGMCAKYVRLGFMASGLIPTHPGIAYAKNYRPYFYNNNWSDLLNAEHVGDEWKKKIEDDLYQTPLGCAVVYDGIEPDMDRNGYIGHIETRVVRGKYNGFISDYYGRYPRTGLKCKKLGEEKTVLRVFTARNSSPYHKGGSKVKKYITYKPCEEFYDKGALIGDAWKNRYVTGVHCKLL